MNQETLQWHLLQHAKLPQKKKLDLLRLAEGDLVAFVDGGMPEADDESRAALSESLDKAASEAFVLEGLADQGMHVITGRDSHYPPRFKKRLKGGTPLVLYGVGGIDLLQSESTVAIIGSRDAGERALELATRAASYFAQEGYVVVSGFAKGVDRVAFDAALSAGGQTIAILPQGLLDKSSQAAVRGHVSALNEGRLLFLSELHPNASWQARFAMMRNRLITALSDFVVVAQTAPKTYVRNGKSRRSGTWQGAETAHKQGRRVFVLDLPIEGNQSLIEAFATRVVPTDDQQMFFQIEDAVHAEPMAQSGAGVGDVAGATANEAHGTEDDANSREPEVHQPSLFG